MNSGIPQRVLLDPLVRHLKAQQMEGTEFIFVVVRPDGEVSIESDLPMELVFTILRAVVDDAPALVQYDQEIEFGQGQLIDVGTFISMADNLVLTDCDGRGYPVRAGKHSQQIIYPSGVRDIPNDATHIWWVTKDQAS